MKQNSFFGGLEYKLKGDVQIFLIHPSKYAKTYMKLEDDHNITKVTNHIGWLTQIRR